MPKIYHRNCNQCNTEYASPAKKFCSPACYFKNNKGRKRTINYKKRRCIDCYKKYSPTNTTGKRCSICSDIYLKKYKLEQVALWRSRNKNYGRERYWKEPEKFRLKSKNRTHLRRSNGGSGVTRIEWEAIKKEAGYCCRICGGKEPKVKLTMDHIYPIKLGGRHERSNIQCLCLSCNCRKGARIFCSVGSFNEVV